MAFKLRDLVEFWEMATNNDKSNMVERHTDPKETSPKISLLRGEEKVETNKFLPGDLITLEISNIGDWKSTVVLLTDVRKENRYKARRRGKVVVFGTKLQKTKRFGQWNFHIEVPLLDGGTKIIEKPFEVLERLPSAAEVSSIPIRERGDLLTEVPGIGPTYFRRLKEGGIMFFLDLYDSDISTVKGLSKAPIGKVKDWFSYVAKSLGREEPSYEIPTSVKKDSPQLTDLKGIGKKTSQKLELIGIGSIEELANASPQKVAEVFGKSKGLKFINTARQHLKMDILEIKVKKEKESSNLLQVKGIGSTYKRRLEEQGVNSREQLIQLTGETLAKILKCSLSKAETILKNADQIESPRQETSPIDVLIRIPGIGPTYAKRLVEKGITTEAIILETEDEILSRISKASLRKVKEWKKFIEGLKN